MTRGHRGSLFLRCRALSSPSPCRFIPAHPQFPGQPCDRSFRSPYAGEFLGTRSRLPDAVRGLRPYTRGSALPCPPTGGSSVGAAGFTSPLRTGHSPPLPRRSVTPRFDERDLSRRRGPRYRGPWPLPGPDSHRLADLSFCSGATHHLPSPPRRPSWLGARCQNSVHAAGLSRFAGGPSADAPTRMTPKDREVDGLRRLTVPGAVGVTELSETPWMIAARLPIVVRAHPRRRETPSISRLAHEPGDPGEILKLYLVAALPHRLACSGKRR
jgi:hypothetical protein